MEKNYYSIFIMHFLLIINFQYINVLRRQTIVHPIIIQYDFSNIPKNDKNIKLINLLKEAKNIISNLILCNNYRNITINEQIISKFNKKYLFIKKENITADLIILPVFKFFFRKKMDMNFDVDIDNSFGIKKIQPSFAILYINSNINIEKIFNNKNKKHILLLESLRALTDCLGLTLKFIRKKHYPRNDFFRTPLYLISNYESFKSINKLYKLLGKEIPEKNISLNGNFYISHWNQNSIIQDFRNEKIDLNCDISEVSINLLNDMDYYKVAECDFNYFSNNSCYRIDQKCLFKKELDLFYINYGINIEKEDEIFCYISNSQNLKNNQCGIKYGHLVHENLDYCPLIKKNFIKRPMIKRYGIPDLIEYKNQTLHLLKPSEKCNNPSPRTLFFKYDNRNVIENEKDKIELITLYEKQRNYFVTYVTEKEVYFNEYVKILKYNGLIRSYYHNYNHNLFIRAFREKNLKKSNAINEYQKVFHFIGNDLFFHKDELYTNYLYMKSYFPKLYNYMPKTYIYPKHKEKIEKIFKKYKLDLNNLWIVKPTALFSGRGVHIFHSLNEENKNKKFVISKYLNNPHLIKDKKYDLRLYVLVTGLQPLRIYLNKEGLVRISAEKYVLKSNSIKNKFIHLTNTAINQKNKKYAYPKNTNDENANKWNLKTYKNYLEKQNIDTNLIFEKIKDIIIKTIISGQKRLVNITSGINISDRSMFNLFGFDILIDDKLNPILLEVNTRPFLFIYDRMDKVIKTNLFIDALNIIGIIPFSHGRKFKSFDKDFNFTNKANKLVDDAYCELTRPRGDFELIFPLKENIKNYSKLFFKKVSLENRLFWKKIKNSE